MKELLGDEYDEFIASYEKPRHLSLRVNPLKCTDDEFLQMIPYQTRPVPWADHGYYYDPKARPGKSALHEAGIYYIQEASAMIVAQISEAHPGEKILDLCAAPGGKSTQLAGMMKNEGLLISNEIHPERAKILSRNVERLGIRNCVVTNETPERLTDRFPAFFDRIVVDAPCSGEGMFRKEEAAIPNWSVENVRHCAERQKGILDCAAQMLKTGGTLIYSTCTFAPEEDEEQVADFLKNHPAFQQLNLREEIGPERFDSMGLEAGNDGKSIRLFPHRLDGEGHFVAKLVNGPIGEELSVQDQIPSDRDVVHVGMTSAGERKSTVKSAPMNTKVSAAVKKKEHVNAADARHARLERKKEGRQRKKAAQGNAPAGVQEALELWREFADETLTESGKTKIAGEPVMFGSDLYLLPTLLPLAGLKVLRPGLHVGTIRKNRFEPAHALALTLDKDDIQHSIGLDAESTEAHAWLRGESLPVDRSIKGWTVVLVNGKTLGWGKASNGMLKNHYPKGLRMMN